MAQYTFRRNHEELTFIKARSQETLSVPALESWVIHASEQSHITIDLADLDLNHSLLIFLEKGSVCHIREGAWTGNLHITGVLMEPYAEIHYSSQTYLTEQNSLTIHINHQASYTTSFVHNRNVLANQARLSQDVTLEVPEHLHGCQAHQTADVLLLSLKSKAHIVPRLAVASDDVICSHGARIRTLKETDLFPLISKGIAPKQARRMLVDGFLGKAQ